MNRIAPIAILAAVLALAGGIASASQEPVKVQTTKPGDGLTITVGASEYTFDPAVDPPVGFCVLTRTVVTGQQGVVLRVLVTGFSWTKVDGEYVVGSELNEPEDVTHLPGWNTAEPDDCAGVAWEAD